MEDLKVGIGVDINGLLTGMARANKSLQDFKDQAGRFKGALDKATDPTSIARLTRALDAANAKIKTIGGAGLSGLNNLSKSSNTAGFALTNLGRVAQDAQFGFVGIANNLNPLLESFQRLNKESGSTKGALKALAGSVMGAGGIGLALSLAIPIIGFMTSGFGAWTRGLTGNKAALDATAKSAKKVTEEIESLKSVMDIIGESTASVQGNIAVVNVLAATILDTNKSYEERNRALRELKKTNEAYFGDLTLEASKLATLTGLVNEYTQALTQQAVIKGFEGGISNITQAIFNQQKVVKDANKVLVSAQRDVGEEIAAATKQGPAQLARLYARIAAGATDASGKLKDANEELAKQNNIANTLTTQYSDLRKGIQDAVTASLGFKPLTIDKPEGADKAAKEIETINDVLAKMRAELVVLNKIELTFGTDETQNKIKLLEKTIEELFSKFKLGTKSPYIIGLEFEIAEFKLTEFSNKILKGDRTLTTTIPTEILFVINERKARQELREKLLPFSDLPQIQTEQKVTIDINPFINTGDLDNAAKVAFIKGQGIGTALQNGIKTSIEGLILPELNEAFDIAKNVERLNQSIADNLKVGLIDALAGIGEAIGSAIAEGGDLGKAIFGSLFQVISHGLKEMGKAMVALGTAKIFIEKFKFAPGIVTVTAGIAIIALAQALQASIPKFAEGGPVSGSGRPDSILARLSPGEYIIKADTVDRFGTHFFDMLNKGIIPPRMNTGGSVSGANIGGGLSHELVVADVKIKGSDLLLVFDRATNSRSRNG